MKIPFYKITLFFLLTFSTTLFTYAGEPWDGSVATSFESGDGTQENPYQIKTAAQFAYFAQYLLYTGDLLAYENKYFALIDDIDLNNHPFTPVGCAGSGYDHFSGSFDGGNYKIKRLLIRDVNNQTPTGGGIGLFADIGVTGKVKNLIIESGEVVTSDFQDCGIIAGYNQGLIYNCHNYAKVEATSTIPLPSGYNTTENGIGGIVGRNTGDGIVLQCTNYGEVINHATVTRNFYTGGIVGYDDINSRTPNIESAVAACTNFGKISSAYSYVGGIIGKSKNPNKIGFLGNFGEVLTTATTPVSVTEKIEVGGVIGRNYEHLQNCMNMGDIKSGTASVAVTGGISGNLNTTNGTTLNIDYSYSRGTADFGISPKSDRGINFKNVYYDSAITLQGYGDIDTDNNTGTVVNAKSSEDMKSQSFVDLLNDTQDPKPWLLCTQLNDGYPIMNFMVRKVTFTYPSSAITVKTHGQTVKDSVWLGSKVEFSLASGFQWASGGTEPKIMYATDDITFTDKALSPYNIKVTSNYTSSAISIQGFISEVEATGWNVGNSVLEDKVVRVQATSSDAKYVFEGWVENGTVITTNNPYSFTVSADRHLEARFKERSAYNIKITSNHLVDAISIQGSINNVDASGWAEGKLVLEGDAVHFSAQSSSQKYVFEGWEENGVIVETNSSYFFTVSADRNLVARFKERYHIKIEYSSGGNVTPNGSDVFVDEGATLRLTITPNQGYQIKRIILKNISGESNIIFTPASYELELPDIASDTEVKVDFEEDTSTDVDNFSDRTMIYSRNHQIFVETFEPVVVMCYNIMGQVVFTSQNNAGSVESFDVPIPGIYFVKIKKQHRSIVKKLVVQ